MARTGREVMVAWLREEMRVATVADLQRAAAFLEFARLTRQGCAVQRRDARKQQSSAWRRHVDTDLRW